MKNLKMDEYKAYKKMETTCNRCGRYIAHVANFIEHRCECGNWIPVTVFHEVKNKEKMKPIIERRRNELGLIYGKERGNKCLESDFEECFWDGHDKGYAAGYAAAGIKTHVRGL